jgi:hypothetical protein
MRTALSVKAEDGDPLSLVRRYGTTVSPSTN